MTAEKLRLMADWFDTYDKMAALYIVDNAPPAEQPELLCIVSGTVIQDDLRRWADEIELDNGFVCNRIGGEHKLGTTNCPACRVPIT